jgi:hypothetical protein
MRSNFKIIKTAYSSVAECDVRKWRDAFFCENQCEIRNISYIMELKNPCRPADQQADVKTCNISFTYAILCLKCGKVTSLTILSEIKKQEDI